jgi:hypothetical protein
LRIGEKPSDPRRRLLLHDPRPAGMAWHGSWWLLAGGCLGLERPGRATEGPRGHQCPLAATQLSLAMEAAESDEARQGRVAKLEEGGAGAGAAATEPEPEPAAVSSATLQDLSGSESESESESDSEPEAEAPEPGAVGGKKQNPRFKNDAEREAHEAAVAQAALQDKATLRRLEEVRARREKARLERDAADKAAAEQQARDAAKIAAQETKKASGERPKLVKFQ